jgi:carbonic anhydrase/acetyltransferase-like protein (isoleucine patch superfamily)
VAGSVIGSGSSVGEGAHVVGCSVVGDGQVVGPGERLDGVRQPEACG